MADLVTLMTIDIPEGRNSLLESQTNLEKVILTFFSAFTITVLYFCIAYSLRWLITVREIRPKLKTREQH